MDPTGNPQRGLSGARLARVKAYIAAVEEKALEEAASTAADVVEIRRAYGAKEANIPALSRRFNVAVGTIGKVILRNTWKHVEEVSHDFA